MDLSDNHKWIVIRLKISLQWLADAWLDQQIELLWLSLLFMVEWF